MINKLLFSKCINKVVPLVYDDSLSMYEVICKCVAKINELIPYVNVTSDNIYQIVRDYLSEERYYKIVQDIVYSEFEPLEDEIRRDLENAITNLENLDERVRSLNNRHFILLGDSYQDGYTPDETNVTDFASMVISKFRELEPAWTFVKINAGGVKFAELNANTFLTLLSTYSGDKNKVTDIYIECGANEYTANYSQTVSGLSNFMTYVKNNYPNARVKLAVVGYHVNYTISADTMRDVYNRFSANTRKLGYSLVNNCFYVLKDRRLFSSDGTHPNQDGQNEIANCYFCDITGGSYIPVRFNGTYSVPLTGNFTSTSDFKVQCRQIGNVLEIKTGSNVRLDCSGLTGNELSAFSDLDISLPSDDAMMFRGDYNLSAPVSGYFKSNNPSKYSYFVGTVLYSGGKFKLRAMLLNDDGSGKFTGEVSQIFFVGGINIVGDCFLA